jgi:peptidyl-prolyl cis-trans isomerase B (cyclophilin B)
VINSIAQGDKIESIKIHGDTAALFAAHADRITDWNAVLS